MKKLFNLITVAITVLFLTVSCVKTVLDPTVVVVNPGYYTPSSYVVPQNPDGEFAITFGGYHAATKAIADGGVSGLGYDNFNLFAWNSANDIIMNPYLVQATGVGAYDYTGVTGQELKYFKNNTSNYDFIGVIPTTKTSTLNSGVVTVKDVISFTSDDNRVSVNYPTEDLTADSPEEFLWSYKQIAKSEYGNLVTLPFNHGNALLYLGFKSDRDDTEILDYTPYNPGTPGVDAYDEDVVVYTYNVTGKPFAAQGPRFDTSAITQEDIDYVNAKYSTTGSWATYYSTNVTINGPLDEDMWAYLTGKYPTLTSETLNNWTTQVSNPNMKLVHMEVISGSGDATLDGCIRGWFVNITNMSNTPVETHTTVHHDAVPAVPASGYRGIRVFSATYDTDHYVHVAHTTVADANVSATGCTYTSTTTTTDVIPFSLPTITTFGTVQYSPTTFYSIPVDPTITHFIAKFSYTYNGVTVYDVRVPLVLPTGGLEAGKYYKYVINITSTANGTDDPNEANTDQDEIDVVNNPITVTITLNDYGQGNDTEVTI